MNFRYDEPTEIRTAWKDAKGKMLRTAFEEQKAREYKVSTRCIGRIIDYQSYVGSANRRKGTK